MLARMVHQNAPHELRRNPVELGAVLPASSLLINQAKIGLVNQGSGLQRVIRSLAPQVVSRQTSQFALDQRHELVEGRLVTTAPPGQKLSYATFRTHFINHFAGLREGQIPMLTGLVRLRGLEFYLKKVSGSEGFPDELPR